MIKQISKIEKKIKKIRRKSMDKNVWLFILAVSINGLDNDILQFWTYILGFLVYWYYIDIIFSGRKTFLDEYQQLVCKISQGNDKDKIECYLYAIDKSKDKMLKGNYSEFIIYILPSIYYFGSFGYFLYQQQ